MELFMENWKFIVAVLGLGFSVYKYLDAKERELSWKKTETLLDLARYFDTDEDIKEAVKIIEGNSDILVNDLYLPDGEPIKEQHKELHYQMDKMFNFLDRISYAVLQSKTLTILEAKNFGWYYYEILSSGRLTKYCDNYGYSDVVSLARKIYKKGAE